MWEVSRLLGLALEGTSGNLVFFSFCLVMKTAALLSLLLPVMAHFLLNTATKAMGLLTL